MTFELRKQSACGAVSALGPGLLWEEFVGRGRAGGEVYVHIDDMHRAGLS